MLLSIREESQRSGWFGWAVFLGISWTWCIGMFLPVLLVRDFGDAGFWIFAIPNVIGAAAMGWVMRSPAQSRELVANHRLACEVFSAVTIAFHIYFVFALLPTIVHQTIGPWGTVAGIAIVLLLLMPRVRWLDRAAALIVLVISLAAFGVFAKAATWSTAFPPTIRGIDYAGLAGVCFLGFLTCPYLDLTFHRAAQHSTNPRASFGVGFGVIFFAMILFTFLYAHTPWRMLPPLLLSVLGAHLMLQSSFTIAAPHARTQPPQHDCRGRGSSACRLLDHLREVWSTEPAGTIAHRPRIDLPMLHRLLRLDCAGLRLAGYYVAGVDGPAMDDFFDRHRGRAACVRDGISR